MHSTIAELRSDPFKQAAFAARVDQLKGLTREGSQTFITSNRNAVLAISSDEFALEAKQRTEERAAQEEARRARAAGARQATEVERAARAAQSVAILEARMRRLSMAGQVSRQKAWLVVMAMALRGAKLGTALADAREQKARLTKTIENSKSLVLMWRLYVMRKRLRGLCKVCTCTRCLDYMLRLSC